MKTPSDDASERISREGRRHEIYRLINRLQNPQTYSSQIPGISDEELGLVYASLVLSQDRINFVSIADNSETSTVHGFKKRFQEDTRLGLYELLQDLEVGEHPFSELRGNYEEQLQVAVDQVYPQKFSSGTIEGEVYRLLQEKKPFQILAEAIKVGAAQYHQECTEQHLDKRFIEYNCLLKEIKKI